MNLLFHFSIVLLVVSTLAILIHNYLMKELKSKSEHYLSSISSEIHQEHQLMETGKIKVKELGKITQQNQQKFDHIKIEILHIHYSLKEICKFI